MIASPQLPVDWVSESIIRDTFNSGQYYERVKSGELIERMLDSKHRVYAKKIQEPFCTRSQYVAYYDRAGNLIAEVHQFLRPDGKLGASGKPDPKRLVVEGRILAVRSKGI